MARWAAYGIAVVAIVVAAFVVSGRTSPVLGPGETEGWHAFNTAWAKAFTSEFRTSTTGVVCDYPPLADTSTATHRQLLQVARCLRLRGYLSAEDVTKLAADDSFRVNDENWFHNVIQRSKTDNSETFVAATGSR